MGPSFSRPNGQALLYCQRERTDSLMHGRSSERGAVVIMVGIALLALTLFSALVLDYGVLWSSRGQAQTSADAGALSGAVTLAFDGIADPAQAKATAQAKAQKVAQANNVWALSPSV